MLPAALLVALFASPPQVGTVRPAVELVRARSRDGASAALLSNRVGLVVERDGERLVLGPGHHPRYDAGGALFFERAEDDGHVVLSTALWVLERGASAPRPAHAGERAPAWIPPPQRAGGSGAPVRVTIDPGHGGNDPGALGFGYEEADVVLDVALRLRALLEADTLDAGGGGEWEVLMTREDDSTVTLAQRVSLANAWGADTFSSIHANAFSSPAANGTETYAFANGTTAAMLRGRIQAEMLTVWGLVDRGEQTASFYVLVNTVMPATLSELGFVTSPIDILKLADPVARHGAALAHLFALQEHHGFTRHDPLPPAESYCTAGTGASGCSATLSAAGAPSATFASGFVLRAAGVEGARDGLFFFGTGGRQANPWGSGTSFQCAVPPVTRAGLLTGAGTAGQCDGGFAQDLNALWCPSCPKPSKNPGAGVTVQAQLWYRDPQNTSNQTTGLSDAIEFRLGP